jgi:hypothetical protein
MMQRTISTDRLRLTLIEKAEQGSKELEWLHEIKSDEKAQWWRYVFIPHIHPNFLR